MVGDFPIVEARDLTKVFRVRRHGRDIFERLINLEKVSFKAVDGVSLDLFEGETLGLLGANGAGKTTVIKMLCGLTQPSSGRITIMGGPVESHRRCIGLMLGYRLIYYRLTGYNNLEYYARLYGVRDVDSRISELSRVLNIGDWIDEYVEYYSDGMKSKLAVARAMIHDPEILILDEPTLGLDVGTSEKLRAVIAGLGKTVLLTTHYVDEARMLSDRIVILSGGRVGRVIDDPKSADIRGELLDGC